jgi:hypothetical protein
MKSCPLESAARAAACAALAAGGASAVLPDRLRALSEHPRAVAFVAGHPPGKVVAAIDYAESAFKREFNEAHRAAATARGHNSVSSLVTVVGRLFARLMMRDLIARALEQLQVDLSVDAALCNQQQQQHRLWNNGENDSDLSLHHNHHHQALPAGSKLGDGPNHDVDGPDVAAASLDEEEQEEEEEELQSWLGQYRSLMIMGGMNFLERYIEETAEARATEEAELRIGKEILKKRRKRALHDRVPLDSVILSGEENARARNLGGATKSNKKKVHLYNLTRNELVNISKLRARMLESGSRMGLSSPPVGDISFLREQA